MGVGGGPTGGGGAGVRGLGLLKPRAAPSQGYADVLSSPRPRWASPGTLRCTCPATLRLYPNPSRVGLQPRPAAAGAQGPAGGRARLGAGPSGQGPALAAQLRTRRPRLRRRDTERRIYIAERRLALRQWCWEPRGRGAVTHIWAAVAA